MIQFECRIFEIYNLAFLVKEFFHSIIVIIYIVFKRVKATYHMQKTQGAVGGGVGSIWNNNNWFYEEKNYTKFAKDHLTEALCKIEFKKNDICVSYYEIKEITGEATITIRKQK